MERENERLMRKAMICKFGRENRSEEGHFLPQCVLSVEMDGFFSISNACKHGDLTFLPLGFFPLYLSSIFTFLYNITFRMIGKG